MQSLKNVFTATGVSLFSPRVLAIAGPMIIANVSVAMLGLVDLAVLGHLNQPHYLGGVALAGIIFDFLYWGMTFLRMGTTGVVARAVGDRDFTTVRTLLVQGLLLALLLAGVMLLARMQVLAFSLSLLDGSPDAESAAGLYFRARILGAPAALATMVLLGWLIGMQNGRAVLAVTVTVNLINLVLDLWFVVGLGWGVRGVALAGVIAEYVGVLVAGVLVLGGLREAGGKWSWRDVLDRHRLTALVKLNGNIMLRTLCLIATFAFFTNRSAQFGDAQLAANAILLKLLLTMSLATDGFANATEALVGAAVGARSRARYDFAVTVCGRWSLLIAVAFSLGFALFQAPLTGIMTSLPAVADAAARYWPWLVLAPLLSVWCFVLDGIFIGAMRATEMR
ncbi:MAG: MATE family efflux transporter, partial [Gammaproteobacteria bacterium]|nr:MATE family efflux transporter [Gammaproteobacteria bacterium]